MPGARRSLNHDSTASGAAPSPASPHPEQDVGTPLEPATSARAPATRQATCGSATTQRPVRSVSDVPSHSPPLDVSRGAQCRAGPPAGPQQPRAPRGPRLSVHSAASAAATPRPSRTPDRGGHGATSPLSNTTTSKDPRGWRRSPTTTLGHYQQNQTLSNPTATSFNIL